MDDEREFYWRNGVEGFGSLHDLEGRDPRNPKLAGLRSVSYAGAVGLAKRQAKPQRNPIGFHRPKV